MERNAIRRDHDVSPSDYRSQLRSGGLCNGLVETRYSLVYKHMYLALMRTVVCSRTELTNDNLFCTELSLSALRATDW